MFLFQAPVPVATPGPSASTATGAAANQNATAGAQSANDALLELQRGLIGPNTRLINAQTGLVGWQVKLAQQDLLIKEQDVRIKRAEAEVKELDGMWAGVGKQVFGMLLGETNTQQSAITNGLHRAAQLRAAGDTAGAERLETLANNMQVEVDEKIRQQWLFLRSAMEIGTKGMAPVVDAFAPGAGSLFGNGFNGAPAQPGVKKILEEK